MNDVRTGGTGYTRDNVLALEDAMHALVASGSMVPADFPTEHFFVPGMYCRVMAMEAGVTFVGKVHIAYYPSERVVGRDSRPTVIGPPRPPAAGSRPSARLP